jgi:formate dehydrogenase alpha subunit
MKPSERQPVSLTIDGRAVSVPAGTTIFEAARAAGIEIPYLCRHPWIHHLASCRVCVVKVAGVEGVVASCATPVADGMVVTTTDDEIHRLRQQQMQFILLNHPLDCPVCDKAGECKLQDLTYQLGVTDVPYVARLEGQTIDKLSPLIERNDERCIRCGRCVAVCYEVQAVGAYKFDGRGYHTKINTQDGGPLDCEFCGQCVAICPVGALLSKQFKHKARVWDLTRTATVCGYCGAGCQIELQTRRGRVYRVTSDRKTTSNQGKLCIRGRFGWDIVYDDRRPATPLVRRGGELVPATWDEALDAAATGIGHALVTGGPPAVGALVGSRLPVEDAYLLAHLFGATIGSSRVAICGQDALGEALKTVQARLGHLGSTASFDDLRQADAILLLGSDLAAEMPVPHLAAIAAVRENDARLVHAVPVPTKLETFATTSVRYRPGAQTAFLLSLLRALIEAKGQNVDFIMKRTDGFAFFKTALDRLDRRDLAEKCGVPVETVRAAASDRAGAKRPVVVLGPMALGDGQAAAVTSLAVDLLLALGGIEKGLLFSTDRADTLGAMLAGLTPGRGPGLATYDIVPVGWSRLPESPGRGYAGVIEAGAAGQLGALFICGDDPLVDAPHAEALRKAMEVTGFVVAAHPFLTETAKKAHVFLPTTVFAERGGTYVSAEGRVLSLNAAVPAPAGAWPEWRILHELTKRLGHETRGGGLADLWREACAVVPELAAAAKASVTRQGALLPRFVIGDGVKIAFGALPPAGEPLTGGLILVAGQVFHHNGTLSQWSKGIADVCAAPWLELHPDDAARVGLGEGDTARVTASNGVELTATVRLNARLTPGIAFAPTHFREFPAGRLLADGPFAAVTIARQFR